LKTHLSHSFSQPITSRCTLYPYQPLHSHTSSRQTYIFTEQIRELLGSILIYPHSSCLAFSDSLFSARLGIIAILYSGKSVISLVYTVVIYLMAACCDFNSSTSASNLCIGTESKFEPPTALTPFPSRYIISERPLEIKVVTYGNRLRYRFSSPPENHFLP
jgi:hypothetical protein